MMFVLRSRPAVLVPFVALLLPASQRHSSPRKRFAFPMESRVVTSPRPVL